MKKTIGVLSVFIMSIGLSGCGKWIDKGESIDIVGSSAMQPLVEVAGEQYSQHHKGRFINVQGGGSGTGLSQVQTGAVAIGNSDLFAEEKKGIQAEKLVDHKVAVVGLVPIVNKEVGIKDISTADLKKVFTGKIKNWKELGGKDQAVVLINRASGSGSRHTFETTILNGETAADAQEQDSTGMVRQIVSTTPGAISYVSFYYVNKTVQALSIDHIKPTAKNVMTNAWKIWSYEHMYTQKKPNALTQEFINYILSDEIQNKLVKKLGYVPINKMQVEKDHTGKVKPLLPAKTN